MIPEWDQTRRRCKAGVGAVSLEVSPDRKHPLGRLRKLEYPLRLVVSENSWAPGTDQDGSLLAWGCRRAAESDNTRPIPAAASRSPPSQVGASAVDWAWLESESRTSQARSHRVLQARNQRIATETGAPDCRRRTSTRLQSDLEEKSRIRGGRLDEKVQIGVSGSVAATLAK